MTDTPKPRPPAELERRGRAFWTQTVAEFDPSRHELQLLREICRSLDGLDRLDAQVRKDGLMIEGNGGRERLHPAVSATASLRIVLSRLLERLALPDADDVVTASTASLAAGKASRARWAAPRSGSHVSDMARYAADQRWKPTGA